MKCCLMVLMQNVMRNIFGKNCMPNIGKIYGDNPLIWSHSRLKKISASMTGFLTINLCIQGAKGVSDNIHTGQHFYKPDTIITWSESGPKNIAFAWEPHFVFRQEVLLKNLEQKEGFLYAIFFALCHLINIWNRQRSCLKIKMEFVKKSSFFWVT